MGKIDEAKRMIQEAMEEIRANKSKKSKRKKSVEELLSEATFRAKMSNEYGEESNVLITNDDGDKYIGSKAVDKKRREQARRYFESKGKDARGNYIQLLHKGNDQLHERNNEVENKKDKWTLLHDKYVMMLIPFADIDRSGLIVDTETKEPLNGAEIAKRLKISAKTASPILKGLVKHGVLIERVAGKNQKHYQFNDNIFNINGRKLKKKEYFTKVFQQTLQQIMQRLSGNEIGLLRVLASKFHYQSYFLVEDPNIDIRVDKTLSFQENFEKHGMKVFRELKFLSMSDVMRLAGIQHPHTLLDYLELLQDAGAILVNEQGNRKRGKKRRVKRRIRVHPLLMFRESGCLNERYEAYMKADFDVFEIEGGEDDF